ncbi:hypothetical protein HLB09_06575, partial [Pseudokineococcus marinus]
MTAADDHEPTTPSFPASPSFPTSSSPTSPDGVVPAPRSAGATAPGGPVGGPPLFAPGANPFAGLGLGAGLAG